MSKKRKYDWVVVKSEEAVARLDRASYEVAVEVVVLVVGVQTWVVHREGHSLNVVVDWDQLEVGSD